MITVKLKKKVKYDKNTMTLELGTDKKAVSKEDAYIIQALLDQDSDAAKLIELVMETDHTDEIEAGRQRYGRLDYIEQGRRDRRKNCLWSGS